MNQSDYMKFALRKMGEFVSLYSLIDVYCSLKVCNYYATKELDGNRTRQLWSHIHHKFSLEYKLNILAFISDDTTVTHINKIKGHQNIRNIFSHSRLLIPSGLDKINSEEEIVELHFIVIKKFDSKWDAENFQSTQSYKVQDLNTYIMHLYDALTRIQSLTIEEKGNPS